MNASDRLTEMIRLFVRRKLEPYPEFSAALIIGSVAHGEARADSDVDCVFVFDNVDERLIPAEFVWVPSTDTYYSIFAAEGAMADGVQVDAKRTSIAQFAEGDWDEAFRHELATGIVISDRGEIVAPILRERLHYSDELRHSRIHEHYGRADYYTTDWRLRGWLQRGGIMCAHDQLTAALEEMYRLLHAYNGRWLPSRARWLISTLTLPWLPDTFPEYVRAIQSTGMLTETRLIQRQRSVIQLLAEIGAKLQTEGLLTDAGEAFRTSHRELGYAHNMEEWYRGHAELMRQRCPTKTQ